MTSKTTITKSCDKPGMTLEDLEAFIAEAKRKGVQGAACPAIRVFFGGKAKSISIAVEE